MRQRDIQEWGDQIVAGIFVGTVALLAGAGCAIFAYWILQ